jgi:DNA-binding NarL/FixJ family response regulator
LGVMPSKYVVARWRTRTHSAIMRRMRGSMVIVDDHAGFRSWAWALLSADGFDVVGEAADGASALDAIHELGPEIVLLDIQLPDLDGFEVTRRLLAEPDPPVVVLISSREAWEYGPQLATTGARGFLTKGELSGAAVARLVGRG